jgi:transcription antitermination factor NusG
LESNTNGLLPRTFEPSLYVALEQPQWYALQTRPRHEKKVDAELQEKGVTTYLPLLTEVHRWSDRRKAVKVPLFSCYTFVHSKLGSELLTLVYGIPGALGFVGPNRRGVPIPEQQIENIRILLASNIAIAPCPFLNIGQRVRIRGGVMDGIEGILASSGKRLVISVETISHSLSISLEGQSVEPVGRPLGTQWATEKGRL